MQTLKAAALLISFFLVQQTQAAQCRFFEDHTEIEIDDFVEKMSLTCADTLEPIVTKPIIVYISSLGGDIDKIRGVTTQLRNLMQMALTRSNQIPTVVVRKECSSACIPILSGLNQMAGENLVQLLVDRKTRIGFHGCSDVYKEEPKLRLSLQGTIRYLGYFKELGGSPAWITENFDLFRTDEVTPLFPEDRRLQDSGILSHAEVVDLNSYRIAIQSAHLQITKQATN